MAGIGSLPVPEPLVRDELQRLSASKGLRQAPRHRRLLQYLVERELVGDPGALREHAIAVEVFRRDPSSFDPRHDPIVRVTTGRLRERLDAYYASCDSPPAVRIHLPRGRYVPEFVPAPAPVTDAVGIAVLSARNRTGDASFAGCCAAFGDHLSDQLALAGLPRVIGHASIAAAEARHHSLRALGAELGVAWLVESSLTQEHGVAVRWTIRLVSANDAAVRWVESGSDTAADVYRLADRMLDIALLRIRMTLTAEDVHHHVGSTEPLPPPARSTLDAARLMVLQRTVASTEEAIQLTSALTQDYPTVAQTWASLAAAQYSRMSFMDQDDDSLLAAMITNAERALALDPDEPVALRTTAIVLGRRDHDTAAAAALFQRALRVMPHYTSARLNYAELLALQGRDADTRAQLNLALVYDPLSVSAHLARAYCMGYLRRFDDARDAWRLCRAGGENSVWLMVGSGMNELAAGNLAAAERQVEDAARRFPDMPSALLARACVLAARGDVVAARAAEAACLARFPYSSPAECALVDALLLDGDAALARLHVAEHRRDLALQQVLVMPALDWLSGNETFDALCLRCGVRSMDTRAYI